MNRFERARALKDAIRAWVEKQREPFDTKDVVGRFGLRHQTAVRYIRELQHEGAVRQVATQSFDQCARFARAS